ncbi:hypothetical protein WDV91_02690 [Curtobacterium flaccumfaciens pv. flaccumfaciens]
MSHKKRASFALKSMGAAGLAAATIVSGLSFGAAPATAATSTVKLVTESGGQWWSFRVGATTPSPVGNYSSESAARAGADSLNVVESGNSFELRTTRGLCVYTTSMPTTERGAYAIHASTTQCGTAAARWTADSSGRISNSHGVLGRVQYDTYSRINTFTNGGSGFTFGDIANRNNQTLTADVTSVNHVAKSALVSGTATPNGTVTIGSKVANVNSSGNWSMTVEGLSEGANTLTAIQKVNNTEVDRKNVVVTINTAAIIGQDGAAVTLERGEDTSVEALFKTTGSVSRPPGQGRVHRSGRHHLRRGPGHHQRRLPEAGRRLDEPVHGPDQRGPFRGRHEVHLRLRAHLHELEPPRCFADAMEHRGLPPTTMLLPAAPRCALC